MREMRYVYALLMLIRYDVCVAEILHEATYVMMMPA